MSNISAQPSRRKAAITQAIGGYINTFLVIFNGIILIPFYLHYIGSQVYGYWLATGGILGLLGLLNFGISSLMIQRISRSYAENNSALTASYFVNGFFLYLIICVVFGLSAWVFSYWLTPLLHLNSSNALLIEGCFHLAIVTMVITIVNEAIRSFSQALLQPTIPMIGMIIGRVMGIISTFYLLFNDYGLWAIPISSLVTELMIFLITSVNAIHLFKQLGEKISVNLGIVMEYLRNSPSMLLSRIGETLSLQSEPILITMFISAEATTIYMISRRVAEIIFRLFNVCIGATMGPFSHLVGENDVGKTTKLVKKLLFVSLMIAVLGFSSYIATSSQFIALWVGDDYLMGQFILILIGLGFLFRSIRGISNQLLYGLGEFIYSSRVVFCESLFRLGLLALLLSQIGIVGVPMSLLIACFLSSLLLIRQLEQKLASSIVNQYTVSVMTSVFAGVCVAIAIPSFFQGQYSWAGFILFAGLSFTGIFFTLALMNKSILLSQIKRKS